MTFRVCKRLEADGRFPRDVHVMIISAEFGLIHRARLIPKYDRRLDEARAAELRPSVTRGLWEAIETTGADEIYASLGATYRRAIGALPSAVRVTCEPATIGHMLSALRRWLCMPLAADLQLRLQFWPEDGGVE